MQPFLWRLDRAPKYSDSGVERTITPAETVRRVMPLMDRVGVTRVGEVTGLDRVGIPNFTTVRPRETGDGISYYNGKGATRVAAWAGALMEAVERHCGERCDLPVLTGSLEAMRERGAVVAPSEIMFPAPAKPSTGGELEWVQGHDLLSGRATYVPLNAVVCPYVPAPGCERLHLASTHGLAAGNTCSEAICHALCEVIERDAASVADAASDLAPAVEALLGTSGMDGGAGANARGQPARLIDLSTLPGRARGLVRKLRRAGLEVHLRDVTSTSGIAALTCTVRERLADGRVLMHGGAGAHPDARVAVARALTEAAQSRVGHIQGGREDLPELDRGPTRHADSLPLGGAELYPYASVPSREHATVAADVEYLLTRLAADGFRQVVVVDLTRPELGVPVVRVIAPGAETWSVFFNHIGRGRFGERAARALRAGIRSPSGPEVLR